LHLDIDTLIRPRQRRGRVPAASDQLRRRGSRRLHANLRLRVRAGCDPRQQQHCRAPWSTTAHGSLLDRVRAEPSSTSHRSAPFGPCHGSRLSELGRASQTAEPMGRSHRRGAGYVPAGWRAWPAWPRTTSRVRNIGIVGYAVAIPSAAALIAILFWRTRASEDEG